MRPGSVNVMYITLGNFTLASQFRKLFETLTAAKDRRRLAFNSPYRLKLYTKAEVKANPLGNVR